MKNEIIEEQEAKELAFQLADRYISIQETDGGYDYTIYDINYQELDGGIYDNPDISIHEALNDIVLDLKEPMHRSKLEGNIHDYDELIPIDYDELMVKAEYAETQRFEKYVRKTASERRAVSEFKAKTEKMLRDINGLTQTDIERNVYAYLQSKINEYELAIKIVDVAISGSRCRGLEKHDSDLDVVVEYIGQETEDSLFNVLNKDGFMINGIRVDINPITENSTGTLGSYLPTVEAYLAEKRVALQNENQTVISLTVAECSEFHNLGEYHENITNIDRAIAIFNQIPPTRMNGIPSIGINIHTKGTERYEDLEMDILSGNTIDLEILDFMPDFMSNPQVIGIIEDLIAKFPEVKVLGSLEKWKTI